MHDKPHSLLLQPKVGPSANIIQFKNISSTLIPEIFQAPMAAFHKPKIFRSHSGCCICKAKSSSSRFTSSTKYETSFSNCFKISESRQGELCNACVLIIKRWRNLPEKTTKHWNHVVDARNGPGIKNIPRHKPETQSHEHFEKIRRKSVQKKREELTISDSSGFKVPDCVDLSYWSQRITCCGVVYVGQLGEAMLDAKYYKKCSHHAQASSRDSGQVIPNKSKGEEKQLQDDAVNLEYSDSDSLDSKEEFFHTSDCGSDEGFCDNNVNTALS